jgi:hypothetical protein
MALLISSSVVGADGAAGAACCAKLMPLALKKSPNTSFARYVFNGTLEKNTWQKGALLNNFIDKSYLNIGYFAWETGVCGTGQSNLGRLHSPTGGVIFDFDFSFGSTFLGPEPL